jgi:hypothetical protein
MGRHRKPRNFTTPVGAAIVLCSLSALVLTALRF